MSDTDAPTPERRSGAGAAVSVHTLRPEPPIRAFLLAAVVTILGAVLTVLASAQDWAGVVLVLGVMLMVAGLALLAAGIWSVWKMRVQAELTPTGYTFRTPAGVRHGTWAETVKVTASESGRRITFHHRDDTVQHIMAPVGGDNPAMSALVEDLTERLKTSRS